MTIDFNVVDKSTYVVTLFWNSTPARIINEDRKGIPILSVDFGIFYTKTDISQPDLLISSSPNNILQVDENNKLFVSNIDTNDYLGIYNSAKKLNIN